MARDRSNERRRPPRSAPRTKSGDEKRRHRRFADSLPVRIFKRGHRDPGEVTFSASVGTGDVSVGGVFLKSTFFLKKGMQVELEIDLEEMKRTIQVTGIVARIIDDTDEENCGFAIKFDEFFGDSEIYLRAYLTQGDVFAFVDGNADKILPGLPPSDRGRLVELIVRWEIYQENLQGL